MTKCYSVRLESLISISTKCYKAISFNGSECLIPKSQVYGQDYEVTKSDSYWITEWILEKKSIQWSNSKWTMFSKDGKNIGQITFKHHKPKKINKNVNYNKSLER